MRGGIKHESDYVGVRVQVIGIAGDCEHGSAVALIDQGVLVYAESEERLSRIKGDGSFPHRALDQAMRFVGNDREQLVFAAPGLPVLASILESPSCPEVAASVLRRDAWFELEL